MKVQNDRQGAAAAIAGAVLRGPQPGAVRATRLFGLGAALLLAGALLGLWQPINKNLWTSAFALFMAGWSAVLFAVFYWLIDVRGWRAWATPFVIYGMNAIVIFVGAGCATFDPREDTRIEAEVKARLVAEKLRQTVASLKIPHNTPAEGASLTISIGLATMVPQAGSDCRLLISAADRGLYLAKNNGRNQVGIE